MNTHTPRIETLPALTLAGRGATLDAAPADIVPALWSEVAGAFQRPGTVGYGVCLRGDKPGYFAGCDSRDLDPVPAGWRRLQLPAGRYAVFEHRRPVSAIADTVDAVFQRWLPAAGLKSADGELIFFERYGPGFDARRGAGDISLWLPLAT